MRGVHDAGAESAHFAGQYLIGTARGFASSTPVIERSAVSWTSFTEQRTRAIKDDNAAAPSSHHAAILSLWFGRFRAVILRRCRVPGGVTVAARSFAGYANRFVALPAGARHEGVSSQQRGPRCGG